jgi:hypothetical protein
VDTTPVLGDDSPVAVTWSASADKHGVPRDEALYALGHAHAIYPDFQAPRRGFSRLPTLLVGPSRYGTFEVIAIVTPPADVHIFHVMALRESTRNSVGYQEVERP